MTDEKKEQEVKRDTVPETASEDVVAQKNESESAEAEAPKRKKKKGKRQVSRGRASIQCTYNNTIVTLSDQNGAVLAWSSSGHLGFKGAKKSTPYAATQVVADVTEKVKKYGLSEVEVLVKGVGSGREAAIRSLANNGFSLISIRDITPLPHNGCRPRRPRRI